jgi:hypothetical protein
MHTTVKTRSTVILQVAVVAGSCGSRSEEGTIAEMADSMAASFRVQGTLNKTLNYNPKR